MKAKWKPNRYLGWGAVALAALALVGFAAAWWSAAAGAVRAPSLYRAPGAAGLPLVVQALALGPADTGVRQQRAAPADTLFAQTGRRLYVLGDIDGGFRPRSNPYDLATFGHPLPGDPLAEELQGVWAQPVKALDGYVFEIEMGSERWALDDAEQFTQGFAQVQFDYQRGGVQASRLDFVAQDRPILFTTLTLTNTREQALDVQVHFYAYFDLEDAQFTSLANGRNQGEQVRIVGDRLVARARSVPERWAVVVGGLQTGGQYQVVRGPERASVGQITYPAHVEPGEQAVWTMGVVAESLSEQTPSPSAAQAALQELNAWLPQRAVFLAEKQALYERLLTDGPRFHSPDADFDAAFDLARANIQMLEAESPALGRYFYAGLETFPFWFSADGAYSAPGLLAGGLAETALNQLRIGAAFADRGAIPHQISPSGRVVGAGNAQETPQWVTALWDAYRWTGDQAFLTTVYPAAVAGVFDHTLGQIDQDGDGYPSGPGMVEREGMGSEKLDSAAYTWASLHSLVHLSAVLGDPATGDQARARAEAMAATFEADWWDAASSTYAMSLGDPGNQRLPAAHWAVVVPLEVGLASPEHAATTLATLQAGYLGEWGLQHTAGDDERVWTLPTATLSRAAFRYGQPELGADMLRHLADTLEHGSIGTYHELIPEGLSFVQLWSAATFVRGAVEDLLGIQVDAAHHSVTITPQLPEGWDSAGIEALHFAGHTLSAQVSAQGASILHVSGPVALAVRYVSPDGRQEQALLAPGESLEVR